MTNPYEFSIRIIIERNDITEDKSFLERQLVVEKGSVDINEVVEDMIDSLLESKKPL